MSNDIIGKSVQRVDVADKAAGTAMFTADLCPATALVAKVLHSTIANGLVKSIDTSAAEQLPGVVKIVTCFDVPERPFATAGHPWSVEPEHLDVPDRLLLNRRVRFIGDDVAAVIAEDELSAKRALKAIRVEYEEYPLLPDWRAAMAPGAMPLHPEVCPDNVVGSGVMSKGDLEAAIAEPGLVTLDKEYETCGVSHCHLETALSYAYMEAGRIVVVSATQIPHILRRVIGEALGRPWGDIRVIKPYMGGGFGNRQDALYEPLNAFLCQEAGGRCVKLTLSREEVFACTRRRHPMCYHIRGWARPSGRLVARDAQLWSEQGAYASHGQAVTANAAGCMTELTYDEKATRVRSYTVYCNTTTGGAMRGYGSPQAHFAIESFMDDMALKLGIDPVDFRLMNLPEQEFYDDFLDTHAAVEPLLECIKKGRAYIGWDEKRKAYAGQSGPLRRGVGMALFAYKSGIGGKNPISLETASCRMVLNQDGTMQMQLGATEIGQGADTVFSQMASAATGIAFERIHIISTQDTDISPFDTGAYASRQSFVTGKAVKKTGQLLKERILDYAELLSGRPAGELDIAGDHIEDKQGNNIITLELLATTAFYSLDDSRHITAETTNHCRENAFSLGCCFVEVEVDMPLGRVKVVDIIDVHDCGTVLNPTLAEAQVQGGMSMGLGMALSERMIYDSQGRLLNGNLLDYKVPTAMDVPEFQADFVDYPYDQGPFGNKSLGEPPAIPVLPAVRNAVLHATGVAVDQLPLYPERLVSMFKAQGLI